MFYCSLKDLEISISKNNRNHDSPFLVSDFKSLQSLIFEKYGLLNNSYYILHNGKKIDCLHQVSYSNNFHVVLRTLGGKGGFGSMLRAIGAQIEKTTNREACRDLSGRRIRDINEEQRLKNWISQQADRDKELSERKRKKIERLCEEQNYKFSDNKYNESRSVMSQEINRAVEKGMKVASQSVSVGVKRKSFSGSGSNSSRSKSNKKKKMLLLDSEQSDSSEENSEQKSEMKESSKV